MEMKKLVNIRFLGVFLVIADLPDLYSQDTASWFSEYKTVIPGKQYEANALHEFFFGTHWRPVWLTSVRAPVISLQTYGGGLVPTEKGSGLQTKSLKFKAGDGREYKFRSLDKDPKSVPLGFEGSLPEAII